MTALPPWSGTGNTEDMASRIPHERIARLTGKTKSMAQPEERRTPAPPRVPDLADRACCCPAKPAVVAVLPINGHDRQAVDIHLCLHHYRLSSTALTEADAVVFDGSGMPVEDPDPNKLLQAAG